MSALAISGHGDDAADWTAQLGRWAEARRERGLILTELTQRLARQSESDDLLLSKLQAARARLDAAGESSATEASRLAAA